MPAREMVMTYPNTKITAIKNLWVRQMAFAKVGDRNEGHIHNYDHLTLLANGSVNVHVEDKVTKYSAPYMILIAKGQRHFLEALEDNTVAYCVHALRNAESEDAEILDPDQIPAGVNVMLSGLVKPL